MSMIKEYIALWCIQLARKVGRSGLTDDHLVAAERVQKWYMGDKVQEIK